jgi:hypothetical protein
MSCVAAFAPLHRDKRPRSFAFQSTPYTAPFPAADHQLFVDVTSFPNGMLFYGLGFGLWLGSQVSDQGWGIVLTLTLTLTQHPTPFENRILTLTLTPSHPHTLTPSHPHPHHTHQMHPHQMQSPKAEGAANRLSRDTDSRIWQEGKVSPRRHMHALGPDSPGL